MNTSGDAAEQVVRMSLEGVEVAARISGQGAMVLGSRLVATLKEEQKTKGKTRLTSMLKSGQELKVYSVRQNDLKKFAHEAKRYGVLYCVLKDRNDQSPNATVDVIARADDASKIQRITERFKLVTIDAGSVVSSVERETKLTEKPKPAREPTANPNVAKTGKSPPSEPDLKRTARSNGSSQRRNESGRASVREKLEGYRLANEKAKQEIKPKTKSKER